MYPNLSEYSNIVNYTYTIKVIDNDIKNIASNNNLSVNEVIKRIEPLTFKKVELINKIVILKQQFDKLNKKERIIIRNYFIKNKTCFEVAGMLNISVRTFFRQLAKLEKKTSH